MDVINFLLIVYVVQVTDFVLNRYDFRGGFWGVMGGPCLGIIPVS